MAEASAASSTPLADFDSAYMNVFDDIKTFFRFEKHHPDAVKFDDAYYAEAADLMKQRIDLELKYLRTPNHK